VILYAAPAGELSKVRIRGLDLWLRHENEDLNLDTELTKIEELEYMINLEIAGS
jgi:hypothetical protein